jgi:hypothetical protein
VSGPGARVNEGQAERIVVVRPEIHISVSWDPRLAGLRELIGHSSASTGSCGACRLDTAVVSAPTVWDLRGDLGWE